MDKSLFGDHATGKLVAIDWPRKDWAFVPDGMPPGWEFDPRLWPICAEAMQALGTLNGITQTLPDPQLLLRPLQNREAIASSSIEGTYVTPEKLLLYELDPREPQTSSEPAADWKEVFNYGRALEQGCKRSGEYGFSNWMIREMHSILMEGVRGREKSPGEFRKLHVQIGASGRFIPPPAVEVERLMNDLQQYVASPSDGLPPLVRCFVVHYQFEAIHPFRDGNGRVGRALLALMIYRALEHAMPCLYMSAFFEEYRDEYVERLFKVSTAGEWSEWIEFCLIGVISQANDSIRRCKSFIDLRAQLHERVDSPTPRTHKIIESLFKSPVTTITSTAEAFGVTYKTAQHDLELLMKCGILDQIPGERPRSFYSPELMRMAYGDPHSDRD